MKPRTRRFRPSGTRPRRTASSTPAPAKLAAPPDGEPLALQLESSGATLSARGTLAARDARRLLALARDAAAARVPVTLEASGLRSIDAACAQVLLALVETLRPRGHAFRITSGSDAFRRTLAIGGFVALSEACRAA